LTCVRDTYKTFLVYKALYCQSHAIKAIKTTIQDFPLKLSFLLLPHIWPVWGIHTRHFLYIKLFLPLRFSKQIQRKRILPEPTMIPQFQSMKIGSRWGSHITVRRIHTRHFLYIKLFVQRSLAFWFYWERTQTINPQANAAWSFLIRESPKCSTRINTFLLFTGISV